MHKIKFYTTSLVVIPCVCCLMLLAITFPVVAQQSVNRSEAMLTSGSEKIVNLDTQQLKQLLARQPETRVIDVRTATELASLGGSIDAGARLLNINRGWLEFRIEENVPDKSTPVVVYCGINLRSPLAAATLMQMGYSEVYNYADGFFVWRDAGLPVMLPDNASGTMLYNRPVQVADNVWSAIGATAPPTYENSGHNNNLSFIITGDGVVVVNAGDNYLLAQALHREIKELTGQPVKYVVLENGQGHAMLGSNYWQEQGAVVIAHEDAADEIKRKGADILDRMRSRSRDKSMGTALTEPDEVFSDEKVIELGGVRIEILNIGPAHSPGDIIVWLPEQQLVISGDIAFHQRLLPVFEETDTAAWVDTWDAFAALNAKTIVPGHGEPTDITEVTKYTVDYLRYMRAEVSELLDNGGSLIDAYQIDQSAYQHLDTFNELANQNAGRIYRAMEFE